MSDNNYWLSEAARLQGEVELLRRQVEDLNHDCAVMYRTIWYMTTDWIELSYDKAQWQRDDWHRRLRECQTQLRLDPREYINYAKAIEEHNND